MYHYISCMSRCPGWLHCNKRAKMGPPLTPTVIHLSGNQNLSKVGRCAANGSRDSLCGNPYEPAYRTPTAFSCSTVPFVDHVRLPSSASNWVATKI